MKNSILVKALFMALLILLLLIPIQMIQSVISEREARRASAIAEVSEKWGGAQTVVGPILVVPYRISWRDKEGVVHTRTESAQFLPTSLKMDGHLVPERRWRGIFEVVLYRLELSVSGSFPHPDLAALGVPPEDVLFSQSFLTTGITDTRGIREDLRLTWDGAEVPFKPGPGPTRLVATGIHAPMPSLDEKPKPSHTFAFKIDLQGTETLSLAPLGIETDVTLKSPWPSPSFIGTFLPEKRDVSPQGFDARWKVSWFGRSFPQQWKSDEPVGDPKHDILTSSAFGVRLFLPADSYQQSTRSIKYAVLFVALTFLIFGMFETFSGLKLHPLQYLLVGFALSLFYLLLVSLSEQIGFARAYLASAVATTLLISGYSLYILVVKTRALLIAAGLGSLYGYLFVLLRAEDYSLLLGSIALFVILAAIMFGTRNVDWYAVSTSTHPRGQGAPPVMPPPPNAPAYRSHS